MIAVQPRPQHERRTRQRSSHDSRTTRLIQSVLDNPDKATSVLEADLRAGADPNVALALLAAAQSKASLRGLDIGVQLAAVRQRLKRSGYLS